VRQLIPARYDKTTPRNLAARFHPQRGAMMFKSKERLFNLFKFGLLAVAMVFTLSFAPIAFARGGGGGGGMRGGGISSGGGMRGGGMSSGGGVRGGSGMSGGFRGMSTPGRSFSMPGGSFSAPRMPSYSAPGRSFSSPRMPNSSGQFASPSRPGISTPRMSTPNATPGAPAFRGQSPTMRQGGVQGAPGGSIGAGPQTRPGVVPGGAGTVTPRTPGQFRGTRPGVISGPTTPSITGQPGGRGRGTITQPGVTGQPGRGRGTINQPSAVGQPGGGRGTINQPGRTGRGPGQGFGPGQAHQQWQQNWNHNHGNWNHNGNWNNNNNWNWNNSSFSFGLFFYPGFAAGFNYGYWGFDDCGAYCSYSPFYNYGMPYVYSPRVAVVDVPTYTYSAVPDYSYGTGYYMSQGSYSGLDAALNDIKNAWISDQPYLMIQHIDTGTQIAIYLDNNYAYSLPGSDYRDMVRDAVGHIRTISFNFNNVEMRSDGAYTATGTHEFYDTNNNRKVAAVSFTLAQTGGRWVIVSAGSSEGS